MMMMDSSVTSLYLPDLNTNLTTATSILIIIHLKLPEENEDDEICC